MTYRELGEAINRMDANELDQDVLVVVRDVRDHSNKVVDVNSVSEVRGANAAALDLESGQRVIFVSIRG